jgi:hypothetical protein
MNKFPCPYFLAKMDATFRNENLMNGTYKKFIQGKSLNLHKIHGDMALYLRNII